MLVLLVLVSVLAIALLGLALYLWREFYRSPERIWRDFVFKRVRAAEARLAYERLELSTIGARREQETAQLREQWFECLLQGQSVERLRDYPGIGPGTVARLEDAGYVNLAVLRRPWSRIHVAGLGERRLADIYSAIDNLVREAQSRFEAGACPEAQSLASGLVELKAKYEDLACRCNARADAAVAVAEHLREMVGVARTVTVWKYFSSGEQALVPDDLLAGSLPDLDRSVSHAEEQAIHALRQRREQAVPQWQESRPAEAIPLEAEPVASSPQPPHPLAHRRPGRAAAEAIAPPEQPGLRQPALAPAAPQPARRDLFQEALRSDKPSRISPVERGSTPGPTPTVRQQECQNETHLAIMELTIQLAYTAARADGRIARKERAVIAEHLQRRFGHDPALHNRARALSAHFETAAIDVEACVRRIADVLTVEQRAVLMDFVARILDASGNKTPRELNLLEKLARRLGVRAPSVQVAASGTDESAPTELGTSSRAPAPATAAVAAAPVAAGTVLARNECLAVLEIDPATPLSPELVRRQFNLLRERYAPHRFDTMGPEFVEMAGKKLLAIESAAMALLDAWGQKLEPETSPPPTTDLRHNPDLDAVFGV